MKKELSIKERAMKEQIKKLNAIKIYRLLTTPHIFFKFNLVEVNASVHRLPYIFVCGNRPQLSQDNL